MKIIIYGVGIPLTPDISLIKEQDALHIPSYDSA
jgi:hypothetical protein